MLLGKITARTEDDMDECEGQGGFLLDVMILEKVTLVERDALGEDLHATRRTADDMESRLVRYNPDIATAFPFNGASSWFSVLTLSGFVGRLI
jgi:hypothetical protein